MSDSMNPTPPTPQTGGAGESERARVGCGSKWRGGSRRADFQFCHRAANGRAPEVR
jgi:hypothetical protein